MVIPEAYIFQRPFLRGLFLEGLIYEGNLRFKIDSASLIVGRKFTVFALSYYVIYEGNFQVQAPGELIFGGAILTKGFFALQVWGLMDGGAYFRNFTVTIAHQAP